MLYAKYGNYAFDPGSVSFTFTSPAKLDSAGIPYAWNPTFKLRGEVRVTDTGNEAANQAAVTAKLLEIGQAFSQQFQDFAFYDSADQITAHRLINAETLGGVKHLTKLEFSDSTGAEYSTYRTWEITIGAEVQDAAASGSSGAIAWRETLTYIGTGGEENIWQEFMNEPPIRQRVKAYTTIQAIQEGEALGALRYVPFPRALYPIEVEHQKRRVFSQTDARKVVNGAQSEFPSRWAFYFEFAHPSTLNPTGRPQ